MMMMTTYVIVLLPILSEENKFQFWNDGNMT